jgi:hypothetical protein
MKPAAPAEEEGAVEEEVRHHKRQTMSMSVFLDDAAERQRVQEQ